MTNDHPSYERPTVQEAICEIRFRLPEGTNWNPLWFSDFFGAIQSEFPRFEPVAPVLSVRVVAGSQSQQFVPSQVVRYIHSKRPLILQLSLDRLVINVLPTYTGWQQMSEDIDYAWKKALSVVRPAVVSQLALRYINRIEKSTSDQALGYWLKSSDFIPSSILDSRPLFSSKTSVQLDDTSRLSVNIFDQILPQSGYGSFLFDIDRIDEKEISSEAAVVIENLNQLHNSAWNVFHSAMTGNLEKLLRGELHD